MFRLSARFSGASGSIPKSDADNYHIYPDEISAQKEVEIQRFKWNAFLKGHKSIWSDEWMWQNRLRRTILGMHLKKKFMRIFSSREKTQKQLKQLIRAGVPPELRGRVWWACSGAGGKMQKAAKTEQFPELVKRIRELEDSQVEMDIEKDLYRTFPEIIRPNDKATIDSLRRVLLAYALRNEQVGYCQSMNYLCAMILFHVEDEERTFWTLAALLEDILPPDYYVPSLIGGRVDQMVFQSCVAWKMPRLHATFKETNTLLEPIICPWFLCLYINVLPPFAVCRVWDCIFWDGSVVLFRIGLALMKSKMKYLLHAPDFIAVFNILKSGENKQYSFQLETATMEDFNEPEHVASPSHSALSRAATVFTFNSPSPPRESSTTTSSSIDTATEVGLFQGSTMRVSTDDAEAGSRKGSTSPDPSAPKVSDVENLIRSAFGYRWLKSVPQGKVDLLRKKFWQLLCEPSGTPAASGSTDSAAGADGVCDVTLQNTVANAKGANAAVAELEDDASTSQSMSKPRVRFSSMEVEESEKSPESGKHAAGDASGRAVSAKSVTSLDEASIRATQGTMFDFTAIRSDTSSPYEFDADANSPNSMSPRRSISDQCAQRYRNKIRSDSMSSAKSEDWLSTSNSTRSSVQTRRSMVMLR